MINRMRSGRDNPLPEYVGLPEQPRGGSAYLGSAYGPLGIRDDPSKPDFKVDNLKLGAAIPRQRFDQPPRVPSTCRAKIRSCASGTAGTRPDSRHCWQDVWSKRVSVLLAFAFTRLVRGTIVGTTIRVARTCLAR